MNKLETYIENYKYKLYRKISKYYKMLSAEEFNMLSTLNNNCLLLDIEKELINNEEWLVAYNLERKCILFKKCNILSNNV